MQCPSPPLCHTQSLGRSHPGLLLSLGRSFRAGGGWRSPATFIAWTEDKEHFELQLLPCLWQAILLQVQTAPWKCAGDHRVRFLMRKKRSQERMCARGSGEGTSGRGAGPDLPQCSLPWTQAPAARSHSEGNTGDIEPIYFLPCVWPSLSGD